MSSPRSRRSFGAFAAADGAQRGAHEARAGRVARVQIQVARGLVAVAVLGGIASAVRSTSSPSPSPLVDRAREARRQSRPEEAKKLYASAIAQNPSDVEALTGLAEIEQADGATADAIADYRRALAADDASLQARLGLADLLWTDGQRGEAQGQYRVIVDRFPASARPERALERAK